MSPSILDPKQDRGRKLLRKPKGKPRVIGLAGQMRAGKDTAAEVLIKEYGFRRQGLADPLKAIARRIGWDGAKFAPDDYAGMFGLYHLEDPRGNPEEVFKPGAYNGRLLLQELGTACRDHLGAGIWIRALVAAVGDPRHHYVVPDVRFQNEAKAIREQLGGQVWRIVRPGHLGDGHQSENDVPKLEVDLEIINDGSIEDLQEKVREAMRQW